MLKMKTIEFANFVSRWLDETDELPVSEADLWFRTEVAVLLLRYRDYARSGCLPPERRCLQCNKPVRECCC